MAGEVDEKEQLIEGDEGERHASGGDNASRRDPEQWVPRHRLNEQSTRIKQLEASLKQYEQFGRPEDLSTMKSKYDEVMKDKNFTPSEKDRVRKEMMEVFPELKTILSYTETRSKTFTNEGARRVDRYLGEAGIEVNKKTNIWLQDLLAAVIADDPGLLERFASDDSTVFDEAWKVAKKTFRIGALKLPGSDVQRVKVAQKALPASQAKKPEKSEEPKNARDVMDDANDAAFEMLSSRSGEE